MTTIATLANAMNLRKNSENRLEVPARFCKKRAHALQVTNECARLAAKLWLNYAEPRLFCDSLLKKQSKVLTLLSTTDADECTRKEVDKVVDLLRRIGEIALVAIGEPSELEECDSDFISQKELESLALALSGLPCEQSSFCTLL